MQRKLTWVNRKFIEREAPSAAHSHLYPVIYADQADVSERTGELQLQGGTHASTAPKA
jgi:hypothetical protein